MKIERVSPFSGNVNSMDLDITQEQLERWNNGELIQNVFPNLSPDEREFIMTGITSEEWEETFSEEEEEGREDEWQDFCGGDNLDGSQF